ncbi:MAG TPA: hypothetical protein VKZ95_04530 [Sphingobacteriaceae bacterium]|nr:hypothetical protein [Sphingobacteriaceae bacterium]
MAEKNIQIKIRNQEGAYDDVFPKTKQELVDGLPDALGNKVDKVSGKGLSTEDFTTVEKTKLASVEEDANHYVHPSTHPATMIVEDSEHRFVSDDEKAGWEQIANKGQAGGYAGLDSNGKVPLSQLPDESKNQVYVVETYAEMEAITGVLAGDKAYITDDGEHTGDTYIYDGSDWVIMADADWANVSLDWANINGKPSSTPANIDDAVTKRHEHANKSVLDKITDTGESASYDLAQFVTQDDLSDLGSGDMLKSVYDKNNDGKVDVAEVAESVEWGNVENKPTEFPPAPHTHGADDITETTGKQFVSSTDKTNWNAKSKVVLSDTEPEDADIWLQEV